mmetsp:Transcript_85420/g.276618  ORF Transcript_85420/g.276618 Transcript_85420/m.276618 type:complete len:86 (-) Transcript_85420:942-1199(-)
MMSQAARASEFGPRMGHMRAMEVVSLSVPMDSTELRDSKEQLLESFFRFLDLFLDFLDGCTFAQSGRSSKFPIHDCMLALLAQLT